MEEERKIYSQYKFIFVDMDNTIAENTTCDDIEFYSTLYSSKRPIMIMINALERLCDLKRIIIITRYQGDIRGKDEKIGWLKNFTPKFLYNAPFLIKDEETRSKADYISTFAMMHNVQPEECLIIDDNKKTLQECKAKGISVLYPQQVLCDYQNYVNTIIKLLF